MKNMNRNKTDDDNMQMIWYCDEAICIHNHWEKKKEKWKQNKKYVCDWLQDCHGIGGDNTTPVKDDTQNVQIEEGYQNGTHTQIIFRRALETCDPRDVTITVS